TVSHRMKPRSTSVWTSIPRTFTYQSSAASWSVTKTDERRIDVAMGPTLSSVGRPCCSETARCGRAGPRLHEAGRHLPVVEGPAGRPVLGGGAADDLPERAAEGGEARPPDVDADRRHRPIGAAQLLHGPLDAAALQVAVGRLAEGR